MSNLLNEISVVLSSNDKLENELKEKMKTINQGGKNITKQAKILANETENIIKANKKWNLVVKNGRENLKMIGDLQNFTEQIELKIAYLEHTLELVSAR